MYISVKWVNTSAFQTHLSHLYQTSGSFLASVHIYFRHIGYTHTKQVVPYLTQSTHIPDTLVTHIPNKWFLPWLSPHIFQTHWSNPHRTSDSFLDSVHIYFRHIGHTHAKQVVPSLTQSTYVSGTLATPIPNWFLLWPSPHINLDTLVTSILWKPRRG